MVLVFLVFGILGAITSAVFALILGYSILAAFGFYVMGGTATMLFVACALKRRDPTPHMENLVIRA